MAWHLFIHVFRSFLVSFNCIFKFTEILLFEVYVSLILNTLHINEILKILIFELFKNYFIRFNLSKP
jgi:hypothetical protein